jgi:hypothetical protein
MIVVVLIHGFSQRKKKTDRLEEAQGTKAKRQAVHKTIRAEQGLKSAPPAHPFAMCCSAYTLQISGPSQRDQETLTCEEAGAPALREKLGRGLVNCCTTVEAR